MIQMARKTSLMISHHVPQRESRQLQTFPIMMIILFNYAGMLREISCGDLGYCLTPDHIRNVNEVK